MSLNQWEDDGGPTGHTPPDWPPRMSDAELRKFVMGWCDGKIFSDAHLQPGDEDRVGMVFMVIPLGGAKHIEDPHAVARVWEWLSEASPRSINGYPTFFSCRFMGLPDWKRARAAILLEESRRAAVTV